MTWTLLIAAKSFLRSQTAIAPGTGCRSFRCATMAKEPVQTPKPPLEEPGKPYPVENPPEPAPNEDRPLVDPVPPDGDMPRM